MQIKNIENRKIKLQKKDLLDTLNIKENFENLCRMKKIFTSKTNVLVNEQNLYLNTNLFFPTEKLIRFKRNLFNKNKKKLNIRQRSLKINNLFFNKNLIIKTRILNKEIDKKYALFLLNNLKKFSNSFFSKRFTMFFDLIKITTLTAFNKENIHMFSKFLGLIFKTLPKKKHNLFISFLKQLMNLIIIKNKKSLKGIKIILNGKLQGKTRAKTVKIQTGTVSINSISEQPIQSKIHIYTIYGAYGLQVLANYN